MSFSPIVSVIISVIEAFVISIPVIKSVVVSIPVIKIEAVFISIPVVKAVVVSIIEPIVIGIAIEIAIGIAIVIPLIQATTVVHGSAFPVSVFLSSCEGLYRGTISTAISDLMKSNMGLFDDLNL